jgi:hypothetical protein
MCEAPSYYYFVRDKGASVAHHWDYQHSRPDHALCGIPFQGPVWEGEVPPRSVCRACQALLAPHDARWWRDRAKRLESDATKHAAERHDSAAVRSSVFRLETLVAFQEKQIAELKARLRAPNPQATGRGASAQTRGNGRRRNSREAIDERVKKAEQGGPWSAAPGSEARPLTYGGHKVNGGHPGLGKGR